MKIVKEKPKSTLGYEDATMRMKISERKKGLTKVVLTLWGMVS